MVDAYESLDANGQPAATKVQPAWQSSLPGIVTSTSRGAKLEIRVAKTAIRLHKIIFFIVLVAAALLNR